MAPISVSESLIEKYQNGMIIRDNNGKYRLTINKSKHYYLTNLENDPCKTILEAIRLGNNVIEEFLAYINCIMLTTNKQYNEYWINSVCKLLTVNTWIIFKYIHDTHPLIQYPNVKISDIYKKSNTLFTKNVINHRTRITYNNDTLLVLACEKEDFEMIQFICNKSTKVVSFNYNKKQKPINKQIKKIPKVTVFMRACQNGNMRMIKYLLNNTIVDVHQSAIGKHVNGEYLIPKLYSSVIHKNAALLCACAGGQYEVVKFLLTFPKMRQQCTLFDNEYNLATISLLGCNQMLTDFLIKEFNIEIQQEFIHKLCKYCDNLTVNRLRFIHANNLLTTEDIINIINCCADKESLLRANVSLLEYLVKELIYNSTDNSTDNSIDNSTDNSIKGLLSFECPGNIWSFLVYCRINSNDIQKLVLDSNPEFFDNAIYTNLTNNFGELYKIKDRLRGCYGGCYGVGTLLYNRIVYKIYKHINFIGNNEELKTVSFISNEKIDGINDISFVAKESMIVFRKDNEYLLTYDCIDYYEENHRLKFNRITNNDVLNSWVCLFNNLLSKI